MELKVKREIYVSKKIYKDMRGIYNMKKRNFERHDAQQFSHDVLDGDNNVTAVVVKIDIDHGYDEPERIYIARVRVPGKKEV